MRVVNVVAKFQIQLQTNSWVLKNGEVKIYGADDATSALLQTEFQELLPFIPPTASSSTSIVTGVTLSCLYGSEPIPFDEALDKITSYLNALDQQEFTVVSAFKDELPSPSGNLNDQYKLYMWTLQK